MNIKFRQGPGIPDIQAQIPPAPGGATDVGYILNLISKEHGFKDVGGRVLMVNGVRAPNREMMVPDGATIAIMEPVHGGAEGDEREVYLSVGAIHRMESSAV